MKKMISAAMHGRGETAISHLSLPIRTAIRGSFAGVTFNDIDFCTPAIGGLVSRTTFDRCLFVNCDFGGLLAERATFSDCTFRRCDFGTQYAGNFFKATVMGCIFEECSLHSVRFFKCALSDSVFLSASLSHVTYKATRLLRTTVRATLEHVSFLDSVLSDCILREAAMNHVCFLGCDVNGCVFPFSPEVVCLLTDEERECALQRLLTKLPDYLISAVSKAWCRMRSSEFPLCITPETFDEITRPQQEVVLRCLHDCLLQEKGMGAQ